MERRKALPIAYRGVEPDYGYRIDLLVEEAAELASLGIPLIALFPVVPAEKKTPGGEESYNDEGLTQRAVRAIKAAGIDIGVMTDVALDPYTSHGQDGPGPGSPLIGDRSIFRHRCGLRMKNRSVPD